MSRPDKPATSLPRRIVRGTLVLAILFVVAFTAGTLTLAGQMPGETRDLIGAAAAILVVVVGLARSGVRRG